MYCFIVEMESIYKWYFNIILFLILYVILCDNFRETKLQWMNESLKKAMCFYVLGIHAYVLLLSLPSYLFTL